MKGSDLRAAQSQDVERQWDAEKRNFVGDGRDELADERDVDGDVRERALDQRDRELDARAAELGLSRDDARVTAQRIDARATRGQA
ncbi:hypothetical protein [Humibacillus xanthopallidus]|uniref:hypothetical protein n=1 Tax=Humibacillus xanthopallidus TaxID=412689 RepID=UPI0011503950|nr:hypothetical protein [Humibacillus xanthopallidus]